MRTIDEIRADLEIAEQERSLASKEYNEKYNKVCSLSKELQIAENGDIDKYKNQYVRMHIHTGIDDLEELWYINDIWYCADFSLLNVKGVCMHEPFNGKPLSVEVYTETFDTYVELELISKEEFQAELDKAYKNCLKKLGLEN